MIETTVSTPQPLPERFQTPYFAQEPIARLTYTGEAGDTIKPVDAMATGPVEIALDRDAAIAAATLRARTEGSSPIQAVIQASNGTYAITSLEGLVTHKSALSSHSDFANRQPSRFSIQAYGSFGSDNHYHSLASAEALAPGLSALVGTSHWIDFAAPPTAPQA